MIVRNKKTGKEYEITKNDWERLKQTKQSKLYVIIDTNDEPLKKINVPSKIIEYQQDIKNLRIKSKQQKDDTNEN